MGEAVVMLASLGRRGADFADFGARLAAAGFEPVAVDVPIRDGAEPTMWDLADDVVAEVDARGIDRFHLVGHAFGNRVARATVARRPERVGSMVLLACGGRHQAAPEVLASLGRCFDPDLPDDERLEQVRQAFFAPGNDPSPWRGGWDAALAAYESQATASTPVGSWWDAVTPRVLVVQAMQDVLAVPANAEEYAAAHPDAVTLERLEGAGHAMLPEQPDRIAELVVAFLGA